MLVIYLREVCYLEYIRTQVSRSLAARGPSLRIQYKNSNTNKWISTNKPKNQINKWTNEMGRRFPNDEAGIANKHMKQRSTLLATREIQIKITVRSHFTPVKKDE